MVRPARDALAERPDSGLLTTLATAVGRDPPKPSACWANFPLPLLWALKSEAPVSVEPRTSVTAVQFLVPAVFDDQLSGPDESMTKLVTAKAPSDPSLPSRCCV